MTKAFEILGTPKEGQVLIVVDHASNHVPDKIDLGISHDFLGDHIAYDIGVAKIAALMTQGNSNIAILGGVSRLVVDLNRYPDEEKVIPAISDGVHITGNQISQIERQKRLDEYFHPYHAEVKKLVSDLKPALILALHSFTPTLRSNRNIDRPWEIGVMYNYFETAAKLAVQYFEQEGLIAGDQKPYSGKELNATMNRQAEAFNVPYTGVEIRQDLIGDALGQKHFADILLRTCDKIRTGLASGD
ncbi:N-formylglutamate amidohydrolase [Parasphingorhabdus sp.]|uniref:N-formylglutamate amidohydrolase n=1 Tax=Parasphingorhabdus sp. TaxID=2709688 RepID=UPI003266CAC3